MLQLSSQNECETSSVQDTASALMAVKVFSHMSTCSCKQEPRVKLTYFFLAEKLLVVHISFDVSLML